MTRLQLIHVTIRRIHRLGACPVLEVTVTYPAWIADRGELSPAAERFNTAYRTMAEHLLAWAEETVLPTVIEAFAAEGATAAYRFDRRLLTCTMQGELGGALSDESRRLTVTRELRLTRRRDTSAAKASRTTDSWLWPELTLARR